MWIGVTLVVVGILGALAWAGAQFVLFTRDVGDLQRADDGAPLRFDVAEPVAWTLFVEPGSASLGGVRFGVVEVATDRPVVLDRYDGSFSYDTPSRSGRAVATVALDPGTYRLEVDGPATVAIGSSPAARLGWLFAGAALLGLPLVIGGGVLATVSAIRDTRRRTRQAEAPPPSPWTAGSGRRSPPG